MQQSSFSEVALGLSLAVGAVQAWSKVGGASLQKCFLTWSWSRGMSSHVTLVGAGRGSWKREKCQKKKKKRRFMIALLLNCCIHGLNSFIIVTFHCFIHSNIIYYTWGEGSLSCGAPVCWSSPSNSVSRIFLTVLERGLKWQNLL